MKQFLKYISFSLVLAIGFTSCDADDENQLDDVRDLGGYAHLTTTRISQFDVDSDLNIDIFTASGVTAETIEILRDGSVIGTADINGETATFSSSILGNIAAGTYPIRVRATFSNGNVSEQPFTITAVNSLSVHADNPEVATLSGLDTIAINYSVYNLAATVDNVDLHLKKGSAGTYMDSGVEDVDGAVALGDTNYEQLNLAVSDTLYYRFTATSGTLSQGAEDYIVIVEEPEDDGDDNGETDGDTDEDDGDDNDETDGDTDEDDGDDNGDTDGDTDEDDGDDNGDTDGDTDEDDGDDNGETDGDTDEDDGDDNGETDGDTDEDNGDDNDDDDTEGDDD